MNRRTLLTLTGFAIALAACGTAQPSAPSSPVKIEVTIYPRATQPADTGIVRIQAPAATAIPEVVLMAQPVVVAAITEVAPAEVFLPTALPIEPTATPAQQVIVVPASDGTIEGIRNEMLALHNIARAEHGLPPYTFDTALEQAAQSHAAWLALKPVETLWQLGAMAHFGENNDSYVDRVSASGYATTATRINENFGAFDSAQTAFDWWMHDPAGAATHRPQILSDLYTEMGIGVVKHSSGMAYVFIINYGAR
jgi:uncharacterized protein YkwD